MFIILTCTQSWLSHRHRNPWYGLAGIQERRFSLRRHERHGTHPLGHMTGKVVIRSKLVNAGSGLRELHRIEAQVHTRENCKCS